MHAKSFGEKLMIRIRNDFALYSVENAKIENGNKFVGAMNEKYKCKFTFSDNILSIIQKGQIASIFTPPLTIRCHSNYIPPISLY